MTPVEPPHPWTASGGLGAIDALECVHRASRLPVVAEATRQPMRVPPTFAAANLRQWRNANVWLKYALRVEDGVLMGRPLAFPGWREPAE